MAMDSSHNSSRSKREIIIELCPDSLGPEIKQAIREEMVQEDMNWEQNNNQPLPPQQEPIQAEKEVDELQEIS